MMDIEMLTGESRYGPAIYLGGYHLEKSGADEARHFQAAADSCPASARELRLARTGLERLGAQP